MADVPVLYRTFVSLESLGVPGVPWNPSESLGPPGLDHGSQGIRHVILDAPCPSYLVTVTVSFEILGLSMPKSVSIAPEFGNEVV